MKRKDVKFCFTEKETELQQQNAEIIRKNKLNIIIGKAEAIEKSNNLLMQDIYRLEAEKRQLVRLLMMKKTGRLDPNPDSSEDNSSSEQVDIFSLIDNFTPQTYNI